MKKIYEFKNQRSTLLTDAETALNGQNMELYNAKMAEVKALNEQIAALEDLEVENNKFMKDGITNLSGVTGGTTERNDKEYLDAFFYAITNGVTPKNGKNDAKVAILYNALTEGGGTPAGKDGGFLVPTSFNNMIIEQRRQLVQLADYFNVEEVTTPTGWRAVDTAPTSGFDDVDEMGTISATGDQPSFTKVTYSLSKKGLRVPVSSELINDNTAGLMAYLARWFAKKGVITENKKLLAALDTLTPSNLTVGKEVDSLKSAINKELDPDIALNAVIITNQSGYDYLDGLKDDVGRGLIQPDPTTGSPMIFKSKRIVLVSDAQLPNRVITTTGATKGTYYPVYVGDYKVFATLFRGKNLEVASTNIGGNAWATDSTEVRGIMRIDVEKLDTAAAIKKEIFIASV
jgi:HK97 family phage major capsid protein